MIELREILEHKAQKKLLPRILWQKIDEHPPRQPRLRTIREFDFFELPAEQDFDLVVGNPPWVSRKAQPLAQRWLFSEKDNVAAKGLGKLVSQTLFPAKELACGFMWKASLHTKPDGRVCQVLPARVFLSNNTDLFQSHWLKNHCLESVWLLADYRKILFPDADCPCFIGRYHQRIEGEPFGEFTFITPKVEVLDPREALFSVQPEDQKKLSEQDIVGAADAGYASFAWKKHHWGTPRDVRLVERLMRLPKLERLTYSPGRGEVPCGIKKWAKGQGFQPATASTLAKGYVPSPVFWKQTDRFLPATAKFRNLVLMKGETDKIGIRYQDIGLHRVRSPLIYQAPLLLINQGFTKFAFSDFDVLFQDSLQSISTPKGEECNLMFLTAFMSSPLAQYLGFHTSANVGIERDKVSLEELLQLPFPLPQDMPDPKGAQGIIDDCAKILRKLKLALSQAEKFLNRDNLVAKAQIALNTKVYAYFNIAEWGRHLIEDTVKIFLPSSTPGSFDSKKLLTAKESKPPERKEYADEMVNTFQSWTRTKSNLWAFTTTAPKAGLAMLTFGVGGEARDYTETKAEEKIEDLITKIRRASVGNEGKVFRRLRGFAFFEGTTVHLLKPLNRRHWTRTAALNDADAIIAQMMEEGGWGA